MLKSFTSLLILILVVLIHYSEWDTPVELPISQFQFCFMNFGSTVLAAFMFTIALSSWAWEIAQQNNTCLASVKVPSSFPNTKKSFHLPDRAAFYHEISF